MGGFRGDLSTLGLADIFQTLANSQKEGTLVVGDSESRKCIYFGQDGLSLLSMGSRKGLRLGDLLLKAGKLSPDQLKELLAAQKGSGKRLGELVVERGIASLEDIQGLIRSQIEDEIFDLFSWKKAAFEFIDGPPTPELMDADKPVTSLKFDVNALLFEASRRIDEWSLINQAIPSANEIFVLTKAGAALVNASNDASLKHIARLTDATRTVDQIVEESGLSRFAACKSLYTLLTQQGIRQLPQDELLAMGKKLAASGDRKRAIKVLSCAVDLDHENLAPQQELALVLRQEGLDEEAFVYYSEMARIWESRGHREEALQALRQALDCKPNDPAVSFSAFRLMRDLRMGQEAAKLGEQIFPVLMSGGDQSNAREVGESLAQYRPNDTEIRLRTAALCQDLGDQEACGRHLAAAIDHLPASHSDVDALARKVLQVLPNRTDIRFKIERIVNDRAAERKRRLVRTGTYAGVGTLVLLVVVFSWTEMQARRAWREIDREAQAFIVERKWDQAAEKYREMERRHGWSLAAGKVADALKEVERLRESGQDVDKRRQEEKRKAELEAEKGQRDRLAKARGLEEGAAPNLAEALGIYQSIQAWADEHGNRGLAEEAAGAARQIEEYLRKASQLQQALDEALKQNRIEIAHNRVRELVRLYPKSPQALASKLPYWVQTTPPGAQVFAGAILAGTTPCRVEMPPVEAPSEIVLKLPTFADRPVTLQPGTPIVPVELTKQHAWRQLLGGALEGSPCLDGGRVMVATTDGRVHAFDVANQKLKVWNASYEAGATAMLQTTPAVKEGRLYFGTTDSRVICLDARTGKEKWKTATGGPVRGAPVVTEDDALVIVGCDDGRLYALQTVSGTVQWMAPTPKPVRIRPWVTKDRVIFGSADGKLRAVDLATGRETWSVTLGGAPVGAIASWNSLLVVACEDGGLYLITLDGRTEWKYPSGKPTLTSGPCVSGDVAWFGSTGALYAVDLRQRKDAWETPFLITKDKAIRGTPVVGDETVYFGAEDGFLYAVSQKSGEARWRFACESAVNGSPVLASQSGRNFVVFGSTDKYLYAVER